MKLLHIDSSILGDYSASRQLTASIVAALKKANPLAEVGYCDLASEPLGHLTGVEAALRCGAPLQDEAARALVARNDKMRKTSWPPMSSCSERRCTTSRCLRSSRPGSIAWRWLARPSATPRTAQRGS
jgi:FMN-dependent NADH-azoreductase